MTLATPQNPSYNLAISGVIAEITEITGGIKNICLNWLRNGVRRRSRRTYSTHFEMFRRRVDGVVIYFFDSDFKFFDDASEFSVCSFYVVFIFC